MCRSVVSCFAPYSNSRTLVGKYIQSWKTESYLSCENVSGVAKLANLSRDRCYDLKKYFRQKISKKNWRFWLKTKLNYF
jgi:hypothetical protein